MNLKSIYEMIKRKIEIRPKIEENSLLEEIDWNSVYKKVLYKKLHLNFIAHKLPKTQVK